MEDNKNEKGKIVKRKFGEKGARERKMDKQTAIAILRSCGYPIPKTEEEWKNCLEKMASFLKKLSNNDRTSIVRPAKQVGNYRTNIAEKGVKLTDNILLEYKEYIPLRESRENDLDVFEDYYSMNDDQQKIVLEALQMGLAGQEKALQHVENDLRRGKKIESKVAGADLDL